MRLNAYQRSKLPLNKRPSVGIISNYGGLYLGRPFRMGKGNGINRTDEPF